MAKPHPLFVEMVTLGLQCPSVCLVGAPQTSYLLGGQQQLHCLLVLTVLKEEVRAAGQQGRVRLLVQVLRDELQGHELLGGEGQFQGLGEVAGLWIAGEF